MPKTSAALRAEQDEAFLAALGRSGNARLAARSLGVNRSTYTKRRARDPAFAARWDSRLAAVDSALKPGRGERPSENCDPPLPLQGNAQAALPPEGLRTVGDSPHLSMTARRAVEGLLSPGRDFQSRTRTQGGELNVVHLSNGRHQARRAPPGRMTRAAELVFLEALSATANVRLAAAAAGFSHSAFYYRKRVSPAFAAEMSEALLIGYERVEGALFQSVDLMAGPLQGETRDDWLERVRDCPLPAMSVDQAVQLLAMHRRTCREGWDHREARYVAASVEQVCRAIEAGLARLHPPVPAKPSWRPADRAPPPPVPPLDRVTGWSKADSAKAKHNPDVALFGGWRITDWEKRGRKGRQPG
jgi:hypothetical protein